MDDTRFDRISRGLASTTSRRQALKLFGGGLVGGALAGTGLAVARDAAAQPGLPAGTGSLTGTTISGTGTLDGVRGTVEAVLSDLHAVVNAAGTGIDILGSIAGTFTDATDADAVTPFTDTFSAPLDIAQSSGSCDVLTLVLGPLHLDVLGLVIDLNQVVLTIMAESGAGNLLGNLLCAVAGLLNPGGGGGLLNRLTNLLNQILGALGGAA